MVVIVLLCSLVDFQLPGGADGDLLQVCEVEGEQRHAGRVKSSRRCVGICVDDSVLHMWSTSSNALQDLQEKQEKETRSKTDDFRSKFACILEVNPQGCVWKNLSGGSSLQHYNLAHNIFLCLEQ